jgi:4-diphosphocytidyl-2-C-methyl-D-erythritol kinase
MRPGFAPAKLNLTLHVTGQRADGYHLLDSLVVFADLGDQVSLRPGPDLSLTLGGPFGAGLPVADNLVLRAARAAGVVGALHLDKHLPPASGMGGGSSDAAATLRLAGVRPDTGALMRLGADLPVCMAAPAPCRMRGLGEDVTPLPGVPALSLVLANPGVDLPTPDVFRALMQRANPAMPDALPDWPDAAALAAWLGRMRNDLEPPARVLRPQISTLLADLAAQPGCQMARMTGSGATCFGIFPDDIAAAQAAGRLAAPGRWVRACRSFGSQTAPDQTARTTT